MRSRLNLRNIFFGWYIVAAGMVINMLIGGLVFHSFSFYVAELKAEYLWSASLFAFAFTLTRVESGVLGPVQGWLIDRFSPKTMIRWGVASTAVGMLAFSQLWDQGSFIGFYFLISIGASVGGFMTISVVTVTWFERLRSRALGFMAMGFGLGGFFAPVVGAMIDAIGWRWTAFGTGVALLVVGLALSSLFVRHPRDKGLQPDGGPPRASGGAQAAASAAATAERSYRHRDFTAREALRTRSFWALALAHGAPLMVVSGMMVYFATRVQEIEGLSAADAGFAWLVMSACQLVGQLTMGYLGDMISKRLILLFCMVGHGAAGVLLGNRRQLSAGDALLGDQRSGLGRARSTDHRAPRRLLRRVQLRPDHGLVVGRDDALHGRRIADRGHAARRERGLHARLPRGRRRGKLWAVVGRHGDATATGSGAGGGEAARAVICSAHRRVSAQPAWRRLIERTLR